MKKEKGITMLILILTVAVLIILAGTSIHFGKGMVEKARTEEIKTNMLLIQAKAREYVEEANFKIGIVSEDQRKEKTNTVRDEVYVQGAGLKKATSIPSDIKVSDENACYYLTNETKEKWGLEKLEKAEDYLIEFDEVNLKVGIYNVNEDGERKSLTDMEENQDNNVTQE